MNEYLSELEKLTGKKHIFLTKRGNASIRLALKLARNLKFKIVLLQDQGGWITYRQFCEREHLEWKELKTEGGIVNPLDLESFNDCVLLINSLPAYSFHQDMKLIDDVCKKNNIFLINDVSGSIGTKEAFFGDVSLGSFGLDKPVNLGGGGFIAFEKKDSYDFLKPLNEEPMMNDEMLLRALKELENRISYLANIRSKLISALESENFGSKIIRKDDKGMNLIVRFDSESEKEKLIKLGEGLGIEHTLCPREIRVSENAVCFEIKRIQ
jgi:hypothetical protein